MKMMGVREFLRGGYKTIEEPTLIMNHSQPIGVFQPYAEWKAHEWKFVPTPSGVFTTGTNITPGPIPAGTTFTWNPLPTDKKEVR